MKRPAPVPPKTAEALAAPNATWRAAVVLAVIVVLTGCLRSRLLSVPLERDEGEYAYMAQLILQGVPPYATAHNMKLPGVFYAYAGIFALLGQTDVAIRLGLLVVNAISIVAVYLLGRRLLGSAAGLAAAAAFAVLSASQASCGFTANTEHFVVLPMLLGVLLLPSEGAGGRHWRTAGAGFLLGIAFLMKQHAAAFILFGGVYLAITGWARGRAARLRTVADCGLFAAGAALPFALTCLLMLVQGVFRPFWFWTFTYTREYVSQNSVETGLELLSLHTKRHLGFGPVLWPLAAVGLTALLWDSATRRRGLFLGLFTACSFLAVCPGLKFREHYFLMLLPAAALLIGAAVGALERLAEKALPQLAGVLPAALTAAAISATLYVERQYFFVLAPATVARAVYGRNPFPEAVQIGAYLREHAGADDEVAILGSEPEIYFYARRRAATGFIYVYPFMEAHRFATKMQREFIDQITSARPRYLVVVNVRFSWLAHPGAPTIVREWIENYVPANYRRIGVGEIQSPPAQLRWGEQALEQPPRSEFNVMVLERK